MIRVLIIFAMIVFSILNLTGQTVRYVNVSTDQNIKENYTQEGCISCSDQVYIIDGDECLGRVILDFSNVDPYSRVKTVSLIMNIADVEWAETNTGIQVFLDDQIVGSLSSMTRNASFSVNLDASKIRGKSNMKLVLKAGGPDGLYVMSKSSGFGAVLKLDF
jgi:hypothetical protein